MINPIDTEHIVEAIQFNGRNIEELKSWVGNSLIEKYESYSKPERYGIPLLIPIGDTCYYIRTSKGDLKIHENDYIVKDTQGEFYPCKANVFNKNTKL